MAPPPGVGWWPGCATRRNDVMGGNPLCATRRTDTMEGNSRRLYQGGGEPLARSGSWMQAGRAPRSAQLKWRETPRTCPKQVLSRWAVASAGCKAEVK
jgi:hypothetical protein